MKYTDFRELSKELKGKRIRCIEMKNDRMKKSTKSMIVFSS